MHTYFELQKIIGEAKESLSQRKLYMNECKTDIRIWGLMFITLRKH